MSCAYLPPSATQQICSPCKFKKIYFCVIFNLNFTKIEDKAGVVVESSLEATLHFWTAIVKLLEYINRTDGCSKAIFLKNMMDTSFMINYNLTF